MGSSEARGLTGPRAARQSQGVMAGDVSCVVSVGDPRGERSRFAEAEIAAGVADDQVIEQRHVENVGRLRQPEREPRIIRARCGIAARVVVNYEQRSRARCEACGYEHVRDRDRRARARAT